MKHNSTPAVVAPLHMVKGLSFRQRPLPLAQQAPTTARPRQPDPPPEWLAQEVVHNLKSWEDCVDQRARLRLQRAVENTQQDAIVLANDPVPAHRQIARCGQQSAEVRIGPDELHPTVNQVLRLGFSLQLEPGMQPAIRRLRARSPQEWGMNTALLIFDAKRINWADEELLFFLEFGFMDYSGNTPPICSFSPHQQKALLNFPAFTEQIQEDIQKGWIGPAQWFPPSIPFQVRPGSIETKSDGRTRPVWNASWPAPDLCNSAAKIGSQ